MSMSTNTGGLRQNLPSTFQDNAPNGGRPQMTTLPAQYGGGDLGRIDEGPNRGVPGEIDPGFNVNPVTPMPSPGGSFGKGGGFGPGMTPGSPGGKAMPMPSPGIQPIFGQPGEAPPDQGFIRSPQPTLPPQMQQPLPGPGYVGGIRTPPSNYRPPNQGGGILRSRRTGMPINR